MLSPRMYWCYPPNVLNILHSTEAIPHCTDVIPTVLNNLHSTEGIPHSTEAIPPHVLLLSPTCTEYPPQYWCYPPQYWCYPPACADVIPHSTDVIPPHVLMLSPTVLNNLHSTEAIPPLYWTTCTVLKVSPTVLMLSPRCTEPMLYGVFIPSGGLFHLCLRYWPQSMLFIILMRFIDGLFICIIYGTMSSDSLRPALGPPDWDWSLLISAIKVQNDGFILVAEIVDPAHYG